MDCIVCNCGTVVSSENNYCPNCGNPLNEYAKKIEQNKLCNAQLLLLTKIIPKVDDPKTLMILQKYVEQVKKF